MKLNKTEKSWILYDVACSSFTMILTATIPVFFRELVSGAGIQSVCNNALVQFLFSGNATAALAGDLQAFEAIKTSLFGLTTTVGVLIVAVLAPIMGAIADYKNMKKRLFVVSLMFAVLGLLTLGITTSWMAYLFLLIMVRICYSGCNIFYDSMLVDVTTDERMDYISSFGYAWGYIGSCIPFTIGLYLILALPFGLSITTATQISFIITAIWWIVMTIPLLRNVKQVHYLPHQEHLVSTAFKRIGLTLKKIVKDKKLLFYIIGYFCYIDGVYTIISMSTTYGAEVGIGTSSMILALLLTQFVAFPFAILAGILSKKMDSIKLLKIYILLYIGICAFGFQLDQAWEFWVLAVSVGICQGGIQSLSRSYYGKIVPKNEASEYFGFFDIFGKFADFFGPLLLTIFATFTGQSKYGILSLIILFVIGYIMLSKVEKLSKK
ncbi:MAG: MFS transporter [Erysipelotrichaceae bacterium]